MPQLQAPQFFVTPNSLADINKVRVSDMPQVWSWKQKAQEAENIGLADLMRAQQEEQQLSPIRVQQAGASLESTITGTEGKKLENEGKRMDNKKTAANLDQAILTEAFKLRREAGEAEGKLFDLEVDKMLRNPDSNIQKQGRQLLDVTRKAIEEKRKAEMDFGFEKEKLGIQGKQRMAEINAQGANAEKVARIGADSRLEVARLKAKETATDIISQVKAGKMTFERAATALFLLGNLTDATDPLKEKYLALAADMEKANLAAKNAGAKPQVDLEGMGVPTTTPQATPALGAANPATADRPARQAATEGNKRITIYKDGKAIGTIPESQRDQAIKEGYTVK